MPQSKIYNFLERLIIHLDYLKLHFFKVTKIPIGKQIRLQGFNFCFGDIRLLEMLFREIFIRNTYASCLRDQPIIIDGGANIGVSVLFFKKHYPNAKILAFEPNPVCFEILKKNVEVNKLEDVEIYQAALDNKEGSIEFFLASSMTEGDIGASTKRMNVDEYHKKIGKTYPIDVKCIKLSKYIKDEVDLLKLDIEGSESNVMQDISTKFHLIKSLIMEFHYSIKVNTNYLSSSIKVLEDNNHMYIIAGDKKTKMKGRRNFMVNSKRKES